MKKPSSKAQSMFLGKKKVIFGFSAVNFEIIGDCYFYCWKKFCVKVFFLKIGNAHLKGWVLYWFFTIILSLLDIKENANTEPRPPIYSIYRIIAFSLNAQTFNAVSIVLSLLLSIHQTI